jgi:hypothetical protein
MIPEPNESSMYYGSERRTITRNQTNTLELELLQEQTFKTACQEIADLYSMLRHKGIQGDQLDEIRTLTRDLGADWGRRSS